MQFIDKFLAYLFPVLPKKSPHGRRALHGQFVVEEQRGPRKALVSTHERVNFDRSRYLPAVEDRKHAA